MVSRVFVHQSGGLGNQLFQYAAGLYYSRQCEAQLEVLMEPTRDAQSFGYPRPFLLSHYHISAPTHQRTRLDQLTAARSKQWQIPSKLWRAITHTHVVQEVFERRYIFIPELSLPPSAHALHLVGYWQNHQIPAAMEVQLRKEYALIAEASEKTERVLSKIKSLANPVSVHLRLGDYHTFLGNMILSRGYYVEAIRYMKEHLSNITFVVFSDDIAAAKRALPDLGEAIFVDHTDADTAHEDMTMMAACRHHIIANSTFSWWGAWLNPDKSKIVCAPTTWLEASVPHTDLLPPTWVTIEA